MPHIMISYQWDSHELAKKVFAKLEGLGFDAWMDLEDMSGNINEAMAEAVENAMVVVPFLSEKYQASKNCKKELNYTDSCDVDIVPCMIQPNFKAKGWLGLLTAGMLWIDFRNPDNFEQSVESLVKEITAACGDKVAEITLKVTSEETKQLVTPQKGRAFIHISTNKYLAETGEVKTHWGSGSRSTLTVTDTPEDTSFWVQVKEKGSEIVFFKNYATQGYLGYDPNGDYIYTKPDHYGAEEWLLMTDENDDTGKRAVIIFANYGKKYLTVRDGQLTGVDDVSTDCRWYLH